jgi:predicted metal-dependent peptidase
MEEVTMTNPIDKIVMARSRLMRKDVGFASMLLNLELVEDGERFDTMATDGQRIFWNPEFVEECTKGGLEGVLIHEACHVIYEHPLRRGKRNPKLWNMATDYVINAYLKYDLGYELPEGGLIDPKYRNMSAEAVYKTLDNDDDALEKAKQQAKQSQGKDQGSESEDQNSKGGNSKNATGENKNTSQSSLGSQAKGEGGDKYADIPTLVGEVIDPEDENGKKLNQSDLDELTEKIRSDVFNADKFASINGTSSVRGRVDQIEGESVNWRETLLDILQSTIKNDYSYSKPNRRHHWRGIYLPSKVHSVDGGELAIAIDTSGSISQAEINIFAKEIENMCDAVNIERVRVCFCDTVVRKNDNDEYWDEFDLSQGEELRLVSRGGGGTSFDPPFHLLNDYTEDAENISAMIYFTDGFGRVSEDVDPNIPVIWAITTDSWYKPKFPFGEIVNLNINDFH